MTLNMKIDLAKSNQRGLAVGLNEFSGYIGVASMAAISGYVGATYGLRPEPFYIGIGVVIIGIFLSLFVKDTSQHLKMEVQKIKVTENLSSKEIFKRTTWKDKNLSSISFAGLSTNLKDGMTWGLFPFFFISAGLTVSQIGVIVAVYPAAWGFFQLFTGALSDRIGRKWLIAIGMWAQAFALWWILFVDIYMLWIIGALILGLGTAMVYPTFAAAISDVAHPSWRATSMGVFRFWRDSGYAFGALLAGILADILNINWAIGLVALLPLIAGVMIVTRMKETLET